MAESNYMKALHAKIIPKEELSKISKRLKLKSEKIVFTNGVFDLLHEGHVSSLNFAKSKGTKLIVGINSDASVKRLKGDSRPIQNEQTRAIVLASMFCVDYVVVFEEDTPLDLIVRSQPDILVKGGDYSLSQIVGAKEVMESGGEVCIFPTIEGHSTTNSIKKITS